MNWILKPWSELTTDELYELLALRAEVFVVEQTCPFQDLDGLDRREGVVDPRPVEGVAAHGARRWSPAAAMRAVPPSVGW